MAQQGYRAGTYTTPSARAAHATYTARQAAPAPSAPSAPSGVSRGGTAPTTVSPTPTTEVKKEYITKEELIAKEKGAHTGQELQAIREKYDVKTFYYNPKTGTTLTYYGGGKPAGKDYVEVAEEGVKIAGKEWQKAQPTSEEIWARKQEAKKEEERLRKVAEIGTAGEIIKAARESKAKGYDIGYPALKWMGEVGREAGIESGKTALTIQEKKAFVYQKGKEYEAAIQQKLGATTELSPTGLLSIRTPEKTTYTGLEVEAIIPKGAEYHPDFLETYRKQQIQPTFLNMAVAEGMQVAVQEYKGIAPSISTAIGKGKKILTYAAKPFEPFEPITKTVIGAKEIIIQQGGLFLKRAKEYEYPYTQKGLFQLDPSYKESPAYKLSKKIYGSKASKEAMQAGEDIFQLSKWALWTAPATATGAIAVPVVKEVKKMALESREEIESRLAKIAELEKTKPKLYAPGTLGGQRKGLLKAGQLATGLIIGEAEELEKRPRLAYAYLMTGAIAAEVLGGIAGVKAGKTLLKPVIKAGLKGLEYSYYGGVAVEAALTPPGLEREKVIGRGLGAVGLIKAGAGIATKLKLKQMAWESVSAKTKYAGLSERESMLWYQAEKEGGVWIDRGYQIIKRERFISAFPEETTASFLARSKEFMQYWELSKRGGLSFTEPSVDIRELVKKAEIDFSMVGRLKPLGAEAPAIMKNVYAQYPTMVLSGSLVTGSIYKAQFEKLKLEVHDVDSYLRGSIPGAGKYLYKALGGKKIPTKVDYQPTIQKMAITSVEYAKELVKQRKIELKFLSEKEYFKTIKKVTGGRDIAPKESLGRFYPKETKLLPAIFVRTTFEGKPIPKSLMEQVVSHELGHYKTPTSIYDFFTKVEKKLKIPYEVMPTEILSDILSYKPKVRYTSSIDVYKSYALGLTSKMGGRVYGAQAIGLQVELGRITPDIDVEFKKTTNKAQIYLKGLTKEFGDLWEIEKVPKRGEKVVWAKNILDYTKGETFIDIGKWRTSYKMRGKTYLYRTRKVVVGGKTVRVVHIEDMLREKGMIAKYMKTKAPEKAEKAVRDIMAIRKGLAEQYRYGVLKLSTKPEKAMLSVKEWQVRKWEKLAEMHPTKTFLYPNIMAVSPIYTSPRMYIMPTKEGINVLSPIIQRRRMVVGAFAEERYKDIPKFFAMQMAEMDLARERARTSMFKEIRLKKIAQYEQILRGLSKGRMFQLAVIEEGVKKLKGIKVPIQIGDKEKVMIGIPQRGELPRFEKKYGKIAKKQLFRREEIKRLGKRKIVEEYLKEPKPRKIKYPSYEKYPYFPIIQKPYKPYAEYKPYQPYVPYVPYKPYKPYAPYKPYKPYAPYKPYKPYAPYKPYKPYQPYVPYAPYKPYKPYKPYQPYTPYEPYKTKKILIPKFRFGEKPLKAKPKRYKPREYIYQPTTYAVGEIVFGKGAITPSSKQMWGVMGIRPIFASPTLKRSLEAYKQLGRRM